MKVLIADDSHIIRKIIRINLEREDVDEIYEASNGKEALLCIVDNPDLDVIFLDLNMPLINGLQISQAVYVKKLLHNGTIIAISDDLNLKSKTKFESFGVRNFVSKPFNLDEFNNVVLPIIESVRGCCQLINHDRQAFKNVDENEILLWLASQENLKIVLEEYNVLMGIDGKMLQFDKKVIICTCIRGFNAIKVNFKTTKKIVLANG